MDQSSRQFIFGDSQRDTMASLALMLYERKRGRELKLTPTEKSDKVLSILNYIAICFVREPIGGEVATALSTQACAINIYIAANGGQPTIQDKKNADTFINLLRAVLQESNKHEIPHTLRRVVSRMTHLRFARKLDMILEMDKRETGATVENRFEHEPQLKQELEPVDRRFNKIVRRWASLGNMEEDPVLLDHARILGLSEDEDGNNCLQYVFGIFTNTIRSHQDSHGRPQLLDPPDDSLFSSRTDQHCSHVYALVGSDFFKTFDNETNPIPAFDSDYIWIQKLRRRLWRIARYAVDPAHFAEKGLPFIRSVLGDNGIAAFLRGEEKIKIVWIGECNLLPANHGVLLNMPMNGITYLKRLFERFGYSESDDEKRKPKELTGETESQLGELWPSQGITPYLHCEIQMITYLQREGIQVHKNLIGNSKLMCWSCKTYVDEANKKRGPNDSWVLSGTSNKPHCAWLIPPDDAGLAVVDATQQKLKGSVGYLAASLGHRRLRRDSSTGSRDSESKEDRLKYLTGFLRHMGLEKKHEKYNCTADGEG